MLAQGSDTVKLEVEGKLEFRHVRGVLRASWDAVFGASGTFMLDEASEPVLCQKGLATVVRTAEKVDGPPGATWHIISVPSFEDIKVQMIALGLIKKSEKKRVYETLRPTGA